MFWEDLAEVAHRSRSGAQRRGNDRVALTGEPTMITRRLTLAFGPALLAAPAIHAQPAWPSKPVRVIVPFAPGGPTDLIGRLVAERLGQEIGGTAIVENRPGANGNIGSAVAANEGDGHTVLFSTGTMYTLNPTLYGTSQVDISRGRPRSRASPPPSWR